ncbi:MAG: hypothetical protein ABS68_12885 [Niastella sp. SCN 39-18]|nr:hypothetical protein [Sphingobacteriales bacterium]ODT51416.1 MAG: hypothetical protein ABS68_12885 [Niastella sp. SCN 39-18]
MDHIFTIFCSVACKKTTFNLQKFGTILLLSLLPHFGNAQMIERVNIFSYNVNEGLLQSHVNDIAFDKYNFAWLSFENGIQKFDGANFTNIPLQAGLPDDKNVRFLSDSSGKMYFSHPLGVSEYDAYTNTFTKILKYDQPQSITPHFLGVYQDILYVCTNEGNLYAIHLTEKNIQHFNLPFWPKNIQNNSNISFAGNIINGQTVLKIANNIYLIDILKRVILHTIPNTLSYYYIPQFQYSKIRYLVSKGSQILLTEYDFITKKEKVINESKSTSLRFAEFYNKEKKYFSHANRFYEYGNKPGTEIEYVNLQNTIIDDQAEIYKISIDHFGNIYLLTVNSGFRVIFTNHYNLKYFGVPGFREAFTTSLCIDKKENRILVGTFTNGLLIFDSSQKLVKHIKILPGQKKALSITAIVKVNDDEYIILPSSDTKGYLYNYKTSRFTTVNITPPFHNDIKINYYGNKLISKNGEPAWVYINEYLFQVNQKSIKKYYYPSKGGMAGVFLGKYFIRFSNNNIVFSDTSSQVEKEFPLLNTGGVRCMKTDGTYIYIGSNKGVFKMDSLGNVLYHIGKNEGLPDESIYALHIEKNGDLWCSTNKGIFQLNTAHKILQISREDGLQENEFNTGAVEAAADGELFFGGVNGVSSFYPSQVYAKEDKIEVIFTDIKVNNKSYASDTAAIWATKKIKLSYKESSLAFDFIARFNGNPSFLLYQHRMEGVDNAWIQSKELQTVRYFLQPGKYKFQVYASRLFDPKAKPLNEIIIIISPPFWETWWFISLLILTSLGILFVIISRHQKNKYNKKLAVLEQENKLQQERDKISKDLHDSIGAYANVVLYKTEILQKENEGIKSSSTVNDLKYASRDIITSLRENIWALKKNSFTADECLLRMKNFVLNLSRYYPDIQFKITGEAPEDKQLHYQNALHAVRIIQEAITNAVKHAKATKVLLNSYAVADAWIFTVSDNGQGFQEAGPGEDTEAYGIENMKYRASEAGFHLKLSSLPGEGSTITLSIPIL